MTPQQLLKLQGLLVDDICRLAALLTNMQEFHPLPPEDERRGSYLYRNIANRRLQLECVNDLMQGREPRHKMPVDWRGFRKSTCEVCYYPDGEHSVECTHTEGEKSE